ncbi:GL14636 [Drosophila persimilis]|uniref:GL14636 n=1 Tax=Drosophila persimilis TaxID=7234 RepID=B4GVN6_DROPE|nr:GL14636 [Drosophila persimilis]
MLEHVDKEAEECENESVKQGRGGVKLEVEEQQDHRAITSMHHHHHHPFRFW